MQPAAAAAGLRHQRPGGRLAATPPVRPAARRCRPAEAYQGGLQQGGAPAASSTDTEVADIIHLAKHRLAKKTTAPPEGGIAEFFHKVQLAWRVFFPEQQRLMTPKEEGKQRLRMILVADRVGMNEVTMEAMRERIIGAVSPYVEIESPELVEVAVSTDTDLGAIYSVAVPVRRVRAAARVPLNEDGDITLHWDPTDEESDPASQFPYGT